MPASLDTLRLAYLLYVESICSKPGTWHVCNHSVKSEFDRDGDIYGIISSERQK